MVSQERKEKRRQHYLLNRDRLLEDARNHRLNNPELYKIRDKIKSQRRTLSRVKIPRVQSSTYNITNAEKFIKEWLQEELVVYHFKLIDEDGTIFYKYGLTKNLKNRISHIPYNVTIVKSITIDKYEATYLEYNLLKNVNKYIPIKKFKGYTECFT